MLVSAEHVAIYNRTTSTVSDVLPHACVCVFVHTMLLSNKLQTKSRMGLLSRKDAAILLSVSTLTPNDTLLQYLECALTEPI
jgi:hypothetical protein